MHVLRVELNRSARLEGGSGTTALVYLADPPPLWAVTQGIDQLLQHNAIVYMIQLNHNLNTSMWLPERQMKTVFVTVRNRVRVAETEKPLRKKVIQTSYDYLNPLPLD